MKMKPIAFGLVALLLLGCASTADAAGAYASTEECVAAIGALDADGDGYVDTSEQADIVKFEPSVDRDRDGRISNEEQTAACRTGAVTALKGKN